MELRKEVCVIVLREVFRVLGESTANGTLGFDNALTDCTSCSYWSPNLPSTERLTSY